MDVRIPRAYIKDCLIVLSQKKDPNVSLRIQNVLMSDLTSRVSAFLIVGSHIEDFFIQVTLRISWLLDVTLGLSLLSDTTCGIPLLSNLTRMTSRLSDLTQLVSFLVV